jgi:hypothetical protein
MQPERRKITCSWPFVAVAALLVMLLAQPALAATKNWVGPNPNNY